MQWCIHIAGAADLSDDLTLDGFAALQRGATLGPVVRRTVELIRQNFGAIRFTRRLRSGIL